MAKITIKQLDKYYKKEDNEGLIKFLNLGNLNSDQLYSLRSEILEIGLETDIYLPCLAWTLRIFDLKIRALKSNPIIDNLEKDTEEPKKKGLKKVKK